MRLLACGVDFGWGSAGKLSAILEALRLRSDSEVHVTGIGTTLGRLIMPCGLVDAWIDADLRDGAAISRAVEQASPDTGIVVLDPIVADRLAVAGCPVVYVDSLPYLWTEHDPLPRRVSRYCAQRTLSIPPPAERALAAVPALTWVDPIVSPSLARVSPPLRQDDLLLVNVGGIHAPLTHGSAAADYLALVLPPLAAAAAECGARRLLLAGRVAPDELPPLGEMAIALLDDACHTEFLSALRRARWVATSPGLTTLLEIAALGRAAALLPPQNLSQFHHLRHVASVAGPAFTMSWPTAMLDPKHVADWHRRGEEHAVGRIYAAIGAAAATPVEGLDEELRGAARCALAVCEAQPSAFRALAPSRNGAFQVAEHVADLAGLRV